MKKQILEGIINIVTAPFTEGHSEVFIATSNGEFVRFRVGQGELVTTPLTLAEYLAQTQHYVDNKDRFKTVYGSRKPRA
ncbi:hypothetical protein FJZ17_00695 [Candidatus Pacearchaeota archaeon]|nr:hypothetical protein [Candidatus Pacearchaeota archaeon]